MTATEKEKEVNNTDVARNCNEENLEEKLPYPKSVFFIVSNEFCERFSYYGMRTILTLYLTNILLYSQADAKVIYHTFTMFVYFFPVLGAIISDSFLGKFNTILYVSMIYASGSILLALTSAEPIGIPQREFTIVGLLLIAIGTGGIKPCVSAFGGDQFILPQQERALATFFSLFYFSINAGSLISTFLTPILRNNVHCFDQDSCFPLAFAVPGVLMVVSIVIFACGKPLYVIKNPQGNVMVEVAKCISHAVGQRFSKNRNQVEHWLDRSERRFGKKLVSDVKAVLKVLVLYIPLPIFWALYDQQGSGWTFQAVRMDGNIGFYTILPDQMQVVNPFLILAFIPLFTSGVYPLFAKCNFLKGSLQRMVCGGFLAALAFAVSAIVSIAIENTYPELPSSGNIQIRIYNPSPCAYSFSSSELNISSTSLDSMGYYVQKGIPFSESSTVNFQFTTTDDRCSTANLQLTATEATAYGIYLNNGEDGLDYFEDDVAKSTTGYPLIRTLSYDKSQAVTYRKNSNTVSVPSGNWSIFTMPDPGTYSVNGNSSATVDVKLGGTYTLMINDQIVTSNTITEPNSVHMLWLLPQYIIITAGEIMFSITGLEFSYSQAPSSMKSVLQACWLLTTAFGNLIIVGIESAAIFDKQSNDFFLYTGLMVIDMVIFSFMAMRYKYVENEGSEDEAELKEKPKKKLSTGIENPAFNHNKSS